MQQGCRSAGIGCLECKQPVIDAVLKEQEPMRERAQVYLDDPTLVRNIIADGCDRARKLAAETMRDVREAMGLAYARRALATDAMAPVLAHVVISLMRTSRCISRCQPDPFPRLRLWLRPPLRA